MNILWIIIACIAFWLLMRALARHSSPRSTPWGRGDEEPAGRKRLRASAAHRPQLLAENGLPNLASRDDLAAALGIPRGALDWLAFPDSAKEPPHYTAFAVPKRSGGYRVLYAPKPRLKAAQHWIRREILAKTFAEDPAHGFVAGRSIHTNAQPHAGKDIIVTLDLQDFFPTITYRRVRGIFQSLGYGEEVAIPLAMLCTVKPAEKVQEFVGGQRHRMLPQGAPTSPALANLACRHLDARLAGLAAKFGCAYTRYADDLTFSGGEAFERSLKRFLFLLYRILEDEGFRANRKKTHFARRGARQEVTGLVVNDGPRVPRAYRRQLRAILHNARTTGLDAQNREKHTHFRHALRGRIEFVRSTHADLATKLLAELTALG
ncbi:MAG TPA: reverse transcriptase family protein [Planctomycetota bacterium]|nr:reverse transcriptase family protein [Planctomycetota bacterium]